MSQHTQQLVDEEVHRIIQEAYEEVVPLLQTNHDRLDSLAQALLEHETLDEDQAYEAARVTRARADTADESTAGS